MNEGEEVLADREETAFRFKNVSDATTQSLKLLRIIDQGGEVEAKTGIVAKIIPDRYDRALRALNGANKNWRPAQNLIADRLASNAMEISNFHATNPGHSITQEDYFYKKTKYWALLTGLTAIESGLDPNMKAEAKFFMESLNDEMDGLNKTYKTRLMLNMAADLASEVYSEELNIQP